MKTLEATTTPPAAPPVRVSLAGIAELYAAACAFEPSDLNTLSGMGDLSRVNVVTAVGSVRRLVGALALMRAAP